MFDCRKLMTFAFSCCCIDAQYWRMPRHYLQRRPQINREKMKDMRRAWNVPDGHFLKVLSSPRRLVVKKAAKNNNGGRHLKLNWKPCWVEHLNCLHLCTFFPPWWTRSSFFILRRTSFTLIKIYYSNTFCHYLCDWTVDTLLQLQCTLILKKYWKLGWPVLFARF